MVKAKPQIDTLKRKNRRRRNSGDDSPVGERLAGRDGARY